MTKTVLALDFGTGGVKAAVYRDNGICMAECVAAYETYYPRPGFHEQDPEEWWTAICGSIKLLLAKPQVKGSRIAAIGISGHSLGCIPLGEDSQLLMRRVPIWSDGRAEQDAAGFFRGFDYERWYTITGNGFPAPLYTVFKVLWLQRTHGEIFAATSSIAGTKDYINLRLTGRLATDHSYASGSGLYDLNARAYASEIIDAAGLDASLFPEILAATDIIGEVLPSVAEELGLPAGVLVVAGGVDNSCMALGARTFREGDAFCSMGSSSWLTVSSATPILDARTRPYVFAHVVPGQFISATSIFSSGTSLAWAKDIVLQGNAGNIDDGSSYESLMALAETAPFGAKGVLFVPTLGGGTSLEGGAQVRGAFLGLDLGHGRAELARAALEGITLALRVALDELRGLAGIGGEMLIVGGGAKSALWRQIMADMFDCTIVKTSVGQQAASLGAAALAMVGIDAWHDFSPMSGLHEEEVRHVPDPATAAMAAKLLLAYRQAASQQREIAPLLAEIRGSGPAQKTRN